MSFFVSLIVPTYNERENIHSLLVEAHRHLLPWTHEIIVVDDQSADGTYDLVSRLEFDFVRLYLRIGTKGLASAIRYGIEQARGDIIVVMDSDFNHQPQELPLLISAMERVDCAFATRFRQGGQGLSPLRHFLSLTFCRCANILMGGRGSDILFGFYAIRRAALQHLNYDRIFYGQGDYCIRLIYHLQQKRFSFLEVPPTHSPRRAGRGKGNVFHMFFAYALSVVLLAFESRFSQIHGLFHRKKE